MEIWIYTLVGTCIMIVLLLLGWSIIDGVFRWSSTQQRADELLRDILTREQYCQLDQMGYLDIPSPTDPQRVYRVPRALGRVKVIENERVKAYLCLQTIEWVPDVDMVVIHKLMIEADEDAYLQKANRSIARDSNV